MKQYDKNEFNQPIDNNGDVIRLTSFPHFNGEHWFEFDSLDERQSFIEANTPSAVWNKEAYCEEIKQAIDALVSAKFIELDYTDFEGKASIGDVNNGANTLTLTWHNEAVAVKTWYDAVYEARNEYLNSVTEETQITDFLTTLPQLNTNV